MNYFNYNNCVLQWKPLGAPKPLEGDDLAKAKDLLTNTLTKLAAGDGAKYE